MKICLMALTGFGNHVLLGLLASPLVDDILVCSRTEKGPFPHFPCENIAALCSRRSLELILDPDLEGDTFFERLVEYGPDLLLVATFHKRIPQRVFVLPSLGAVNIHSSLLPDYRGPTPSHWAILKGEEVTGVTYHSLVEKMDAGDILQQHELSIGHSTAGQLREKLARLAGDTVGVFLELLSKDRLVPRRQDVTEGSYYPRIWSRRGLARLRSGHYDVERVSRALSPYPGVSILEK